MKLKLICAMLLLCFITLIAKAQKDLPVAGNAATLIDYLRKDYSSINPESIAQELSRDETSVISMFKAYLTEDQQKALSVTRIAGYTDLEKQFIEYTNYKKQLELAPEKADQQLISMIEICKTTYYETKSKSDFEELGYLREAYQISENQVIAAVIDLFKEKYGSIHAKNTFDRFAVGNPTGAINKGSPFFGGDMVFTTAIDGLAKFLVKRMKQELVVYVVENLKITLQNPSEDDPMAELKVILPRTAAMIVNFRSDQIANFPTEVKKQIEDDLNHLANNLIGLAHTPRVKKLVNNYPDFAFALEAVEIIPNISKIRTASDFFSLLESSRILNEWKTNEGETKNNIFNTVLFTAMMARSLTVIENEELRFANARFLTSYLQEPNFYQLYIGFLHQQNLKYYKITLKPSGYPELVVSELLKPALKSSNALDLKPNIENILATASRNTESITTLSQKIRKSSESNGQIGPDTIYAFVNSIIEFSSDMTSGVETLVNKLAVNVSPKCIPLKEKLDPYYQIARKSNDLIRDLANKRYTNALLKSIEIASELGSRTKLSKLTDAIQKVKLAYTNGQVSHWHQVLKVINDSKGNSNLSQAAVRSFTLINTELSKISLFYTVNNENTPLLEQIKKMQLCIKDGMRVAAIGGDDLKAAKVLIVDPDFQKLVISYYSNTEINSLLSETRAELETLVMKTPSGGTVRIFKTSEIDDLTFTLSSYVKSVFENYFIEGNNSDDKKLIETQKRLSNVIDGFLAVLPQHFSVVSNRDLLRILQFAGNMAQTKTSDEVQQVFEQFALPTGSYTIKRESKLNVALNAYPGLLIGADVVTGLPKEKLAFSPGFTAPVGVAVAWSSRKGATNGFFIPVIDIGAVTRFRFDGDNNTKALPKLNFSNIFSPGVYYSHGLRKSPFAYNFGVQYGPELERVDPANSSLVNSLPAFRINLGIALDIALFNLHTKTK